MSPFKFLGEELPRFRKIWRIDENSYQIVAVHLPLMLPITSNCLRFRRKLPELIGAFQEWFGQSTRPDSFGRY